MSKNHIIVYHARDYNGVLWGALKQRIVRKGQGHFDGFRTT